MPASTLLSLNRSRFRPIWAFVAAVAIVLLGFGAVYAYRAAARSYHLRAAAEARARQDYATERTHLLACLQAGGASQDVYLQAARCCRHLRDFDGAQHFLRECELLRGQAPDPAVNLERVLVGVESGNLSHTDPNVIQAARQAPDGDPGIGELLGFVAKKYIRDYMFGSARSALNLWSERDPKAVEPLLLQGWIVEQLNVNYQPAIPYFEKALELEPDNRIARLRLAEALQTIRQSEQAQPHLEKLREQKPDAAYVLYQLAVCVLDQGETKDAADLLDQVLTPERLTLMEQMAVCLHAGHGVPEVVEAAPWYQQLMADVPYGAQGEPDYILSFFVRGLTQRARVARSLGTDGEPFLREAVKLDPFDYDPTYQLVVLLERKGRAEEAKPLREQMAAIRKDLDRMTETAQTILDHPLDPEPRCVAAEIQLRFRQPGQARLWLASALRQSPGYPRAVRLLEECEKLKRRPVPGCSGGELPPAPPGAAPDTGP